MRAVSAVAELLVASIADGLVVRLIIGRTTSATYWCRRDLWVSAADLSASS